MRHFIRGYIRFFARLGTLLIRPTPDEMEQHGEAFAIATIFMLFALLCVSVVMAL